jgi:hypothetical protein
MLLCQLTLEFDRLLIQLLSALKRFLFKLLTSGGELLFKLGMLGLHVLLHLSGLLSSSLKHLLALLSNLLAHLADLPFSLLTDGGLRHELFALLLGVVDDLVSLASGRGDELVPFLQKLIRLSHLSGHGFANGIQQLNGVLLVDEPPAAEGNATALQHDLLELIELVEYGEPDLAHRDG